MKLKARESVVVQLPVMARDFARFDELRQEWAVQGGRGGTSCMFKNAADTDVSMGTYRSEPGDIRTFLSEAGSGGPASMVRPHRWLPGYLLYLNWVSAVKRPPCHKLPSWFTWDFGAGSLGFIGCCGIFEAGRYLPPVL